MFAKILNIFQFTNIKSKICVDLIIIEEKRNELSVKVFILFSKVELT